MNIGANAFNGCSGLMSILIPTSVTDIGKFVLYDSIPIIITISLLPLHLPFIGAGLFDGCSGLNDIKFSLSLRSLLPYNWTTNNSKLFTVLDYLFDFLSW